MRIKKFLLPIASTLMITPMIVNAQQNTKPNIILILADDLGYGDLGCFGATKIKTPVIDRLAANGIRFTDAHSSGTVCQPSRYGIMTGRYFWRSQKAIDAFEQRGLNGYMPEMIEDSILTLPEMLKENGYKTAIIGKWHLGANWQLTNGEIPKSDGTNVDHGKPYTGGPNDHGFDYFFGIIGSHGMPPYVFFHNDRTDGLPVRMREFKPTVSSDGLMADNWKDEKLGTVLTQKAIRFIKEQSNSEEPFFLFLSLSAPHAPYVPPDFLKGKSGCGPRGDMVMEADWTVGEVMKALQKQKIDKETLVIFISDNGGIVDGITKWAIDPVRYNIVDYGHHANGYLRGEKGDLWEGGHRVPMIVYWPKKISKALTNNRLISLTDIYPTISEIIKNAKPIPFNEDNRSFADLILSEINIENKKDRMLIHQAYRDGAFALRINKWKYIKSPVSGGFMGPKAPPVWDKNDVQLYDMKEDPIEQQNLARFYPELIHKMDSILSKEVQ